MKCRLPKWTLNLKIRSVSYKICASDLLFIRGRNLLSQLPPLKRVAWMVTLKGSKSWTVISPQRRWGSREMFAILLFAGTPKSKIRSPAVGGFSQNDVLFYNCLLWAFAAAVSTAEWFSIAAYQSRPVRRGLSAAMTKDTLLRVLCVSSEAPS